MQMTKDSTVSMVETAAMTGESSHWMLEYIFTGSVVVVAEARNQEITTSSNEIRNANRAAARIDGASCGNTTVVNIRYGPAPIRVAPNSRFASSFCTPAAIITMTKGVT